MKKFSKKIVTLIIAAIVLVTSITTVNAVENSIQLGSASKTNAYIAGVSFYYKVTTDGRYLYCLNMHKKTATNIQANIVTNSNKINGGIIYILKNGYPNKSITGDKDKDYYITQTAVWWYLDKTTGSQNLGEQFKGSGSDAYGLRKYVKQLVDEAYNHRNDSYGFSEAKLAIAPTGGSDMTLKDGYYISNAIKATTAKNVNNYTVTLKDAPKGTLIVHSNGKENEYKNGSKISVSDWFKVKVPATSVSGTKLTIKVNAASDSVDQYTAYEYQPVDNDMQNIALLYKQTVKAEASTNLEITSSRITVIKVDSKTKKAIAGAKLVMKDANGKEVASWTSTTNAHILRNIANGTYTIEETQAPSGYLLNKKVTQITVSDTNRDIKVTIENAPKNVVVNITKIDQETNEALAGAILVVKDSTGKEVARFTTSTTSYVLTDLANGTYTVEEVAAPSGYMKSNEVITFTVDDDHLSHQIIFKNAKEVVVPDTASLPSMLFIFLGIVITGTGISYIRKYAKQN